MILSAFNKGMSDEFETNPLTRGGFFIELWFYKDKTVLSLKKDVS